MSNPVWGRINLRTTYSLWRREITKCMEALTYNPRLCQTLMANAWKKCPCPSLREMKLYRDRLSKERMERHVIQVAFFHS